MSHSWLQRKRKGELLELAQKAGIADSDGLLKDDLVERLEERLNASETTYAKQPEFRDYYGRSGSPVKRERSSPSDALTVTKARRRTLVKVPSEEPTPVKDTTALATRTPRAIARRVSEVLSEVDIPASPARLADVAENQIEQIKGKATELWDRTRIDYFKELLRENASSVATIQTLILLIEAAGLQWNTLQTTPTVNVPESLKNLTSNQYVFVPDFLALLTSEWWAPATLWSLTSWVLPLIVSYFFNLTLRSNTQRKSSDRQYPADPFTFNIMKAILVYTAYQYPSVDAGLVGEPNTVRTHDLSWGPFSSATVGVVRNNVPGGYYGLQIGALVGVLVSLYDAALKK